MPPRLGTQNRPLRVAVIGSGPSGFYAVAALFEQEGLAVEVDVFDRLPTPFGLVRGGVAPDHQNIKNVIRVYNKTAARVGFRFFGNVVVSKDLSVDDLGRFYDQIVFAVGNESDRKLEIPGEELSGVYSATEFVGWYNGHPDFQDLEFDLSSAGSVAVVGNGNVAMDVARILARDPAELAPTDITDRALEALRRSRVSKIHLLGRRGPAQAAFSPKEIKEVGSLRGADLVVTPSEVDLDPLSLAWLETEAPSAKKNVAYLIEKSRAGEGTAERKIYCRFLVSPVEILGENGRVKAIRLERNELHADRDGTPRPRGTGRLEDLDVDFVFKAVGYRGLPLAGVPFDERAGIFPNDDGRLLDSASRRPIAGHYVVGWAKRGPSGLIGTNGPDSEATVARMVEDLAAGRVPGAPEHAPEAIVELLRARGTDFASFGDWARLDGDEVARGKAKGKVRDKYTEVASMMAAIHNLREG